MYSLETNSVGAELLLAGVVRFALAQKDKGVFLHTTDEERPGLALS